MAWAVPEAWHRRASTREVGPRGLGGPTRAFLNDFLGGGAKWLVTEGQSCWLEKACGLEIGCWLGNSCWLEKDVGWEKTAGWEPTAPLTFSSKRDWWGEGKGSPVSRKKVAGGLFARCLTGSPPKEGVSPVVKKALCPTSTPEVRPSLCLCPIPVTFETQKNNSFKIPEEYSVQIQQPGLWLTNQ